MTKIFLSGTFPTIVQQSESLQFEIIDYSEKAIALFGDTKEIKDSLKDFGGRFNPRLAYNGGRNAGWVFPKVKREALERILNLKK